MLKSRQIRAARALLNWSQDDLASAAALPLAAVQAIEETASSNVSEALTNLQDTFEKAGVEFLFTNGLRLRKQAVTMLHGANAYWTLLDDITNTLIEKGGEVCVLGMDEQLVAQALDSDPVEGSEKLIRYVMKLQKHRLRCRSIIKKGDTHIVAPLSWYRCIDEEYFASHPLYIYADKIGILQLGSPMRAIIYDNLEIAGSLRKTFNFVWNHSHPLQLGQVA